MLPVLCLLRKEIYIFIQLLIQNPEWAVDVCGANACLVEAASIPSPCCVFDCFPNAYLM